MQNPHATSRCEPARLDVVSASGHVPAVCWRPSSLPRGIVLACHGGSGHKTSPAVMAIVDKCLPLGLSVLAIDGPVHGERSDGNLNPEASRQRFLQAWVAGSANASMVQDMQAALDAALRLPGHAECPVAYMGVSMGTAYGVPLLAAEPRIRAAAIGLWSSRARASEQLATAAKGISCAVWFTQQWNDEFFDREGTFELFDAVGSPDKRLVAYPGPHIELQDERLDDAVRFVHARLSASVESPSTASNHPRS